CESGALRPSGKNASLRGPDCFASDSACGDCLSRSFRPGKWEGNRSPERSWRGGAGGRAGKRGLACKPTIFYPGAVAATLYNDEMGTDGGRLFCADRWFAEMDQR